MRSKGFLAIMEAGWIDNDLEIFVLHRSGEKNVMFHGSPACSLAASGSTQVTLSIQYMYDNYLQICKTCNSKLKITDAEGIDFPENSRHDFSMFSQGFKERVAFIEKYKEFDHSSADQIFAVDGLRERIKNLGRMTGSFSVTPATKLNQTIRDLYCQDKASFRKLAKSMAADGSMRAQAVETLITRVREETSSTRSSVAILTGGSKARAQYLKQLELELLNDTTHIIFSFYPRSGVLGNKEALLSEAYGVRDEAFVTMPLVEFSALFQDVTHVKDSIIIDHEPDAKILEICRGIYRPEDHDSPLSKMVAVYAAAQEI